MIAARFPRDESEIEPQGIAALSRQLNVAVPVDGEAFLTGRTAERLRAEIPRPKTSTNATPNAVGIAWTRADKVDWD